MIDIHDIIIIMREGIKNY